MLTGVTALKAACRKQSNCDPSFNHFMERVEGSKIIQAQMGMFPHL